MARSKKAKGKSLKITRKKKKTAKKVSRKRLVIKVSKFNRLLKKARTLSKKALKTALKGTSVSKITERTCKKIDAAIAKDPVIATAIQNAVVAVVNSITAVKAPKTKKTKPEAAVPAEAASE